MSSSVVDDVLVGLASPTRDNMSSIMGISPVNKKKYIVERATNSDAIGLEYDNRNNDGQYPKSHHIVHEVLTKNNSLELCQEQIDTLFEIDSWLKSDNPIAILDGRAGSGKTTLLKYVVSMLEKKKKTWYRKSTQRRINLGI